MLQGDSYKIAFNIKENGIGLTPDTVDDVEICIGQLQKTYQNGEVTYNSGKWYFPLSQDETFSLFPTEQAAQIRVLFKTGNVKGIALNPINVHESMSKTVLEGAT